LRAVKLAGVAALFIGFMLTQNGLALGASPADPIRIDDCHITNPRFYAPFSKSLALTFTNRRSIAADEVRFTVEYAGRMVHVTDTGTFSTNIGIHRTFDAFPASLYYYYGFWPKNCTVDYVRYSDGSIWIPRTPSRYA
jgi:hypothetical protein